MTTDNDDPIEMLSDDECWALLAKETLGRLAVSVRGEPDIFPVNYAVMDRSIVVRTTAGSKLVSLMLNASVAFEIDGLREQDNVAWSVVAKGLARDVQPGPIAEAIAELPLVPWNTSPKNHLVLIEATDVSGRSFEAKGRT
jgi:nitroimidazol reductase NimA-like FMN-containing flavoprotein (pyridoxamine 5'-phosphate oxidase superfamily)